MKKAIRKILTLGLALIMIFSLAACNLDDGLAEYKANAKTEIQTYADNKIAENGYTEQGLQAIEQAAANGKTTIDAATDEAGVDAALLAAKDAIDLVMTELAMYRAEAKKTLKDYAGEQENYFEEDWAFVEEAVEDGKKAIDAAADEAGVDAALSAAKDAIDLVPKKDEADFTLTISVDKATVALRETFKVNIELKNNSENTFNIVEYFVLFWVYTPYYGERLHHWMPRERIFEAKGIIQEEKEVNFFDLGFRLGLKEGVHDLRFSAEFYVKERAQYVEVLSNIVVLTVQ